MNLRDPIRRLERGACSCRDEPQRPLVYYPDEGEPVPEPELCPSCNRVLTALVRVVYEDDLDENEVVAFEDDADRVGGR